MSNTVETSQDVVYTISKGAETIYSTRMLHMLEKELHGLVFDYFYFNIIGIAIQERFDLDQYNKIDTVIDELCSVCIKNIIDGVPSVIAEYSVDCFKKEKHTTAINKVKHLETFLRSRKGELV